MRDAGPDPLGPRIPPLLPTPSVLDGLPAELASFRLLRSEEASLLLGWPESTLRAWRSRRPGSGPSATLLGGAVRYRHIDLEAWLGDQVGYAAFRPASIELPAVRPLSDAEASRLLGLAPQTLRTWRARRSRLAPPAVVQGRWVRYPLPPLWAWIELFVEGRNGEAPPAVTAGRVAPSRRGRARSDQTVGPF